MKGQITGMRGVYLVAAELARRGFIASPTSRSAIGADILVTDESCLRAFSVQVKTNGKAANNWLIGLNTPVSESHIYVLVNIHTTKQAEQFEYYVVPSAILAKKKKVAKRIHSEWHYIDKKDLVDYRGAWEIFREPAPSPHRKPKTIL